MVDKALFSSDSTEWCVPSELFNKCNNRWGPFALDAAATLNNTQCDVFYTKDDDALKHNWYGRVWVNPPYGREVGRWVKYAYEQVMLGFAQRVVMLLPSRTDTKWWHEWVKRAREIHFLKGRVCFVGGNSCAPFPSVVVVFEREFE